MTSCLVMQYNIEYGLVFATVDKVTHSYPVRTLP